MLLKIKKIHKFENYGHLRKKGIVTLYNNGVEQGPRSSKNFSLKAIRSYFPKFSQSNFIDKRQNLEKKRKKYIKEVRDIIIQKIMLFENATPSIDSRLETYKKMLKKSLQYGHSIIKCHPGMKKFVRGQFNGKYLINLIKTRRYLIRVLWFLTKYAYQKKTVLFVGTTIPTSRFIATAAVKTKSFFINVRWLGGMLTNWRTIEKLLKKLRELQSKKFLSSSSPSKLQSTNLVEFKNQIDFLNIPERNEMVGAGATQTLSLKKKEFTNLPKKELAMRKKEKQRLEKYLKGIKMLKNLPQVVILATQTNDISAAYECKKLGICNITIVDTDCNPNLADFIIPANDDSASSIKYILYYLAKAIKIGTTLSIMKNKLRKKIFLFKARAHEVG
uniref:Small ribosomal subunit protein uS2c n=1 Tax=Koshicola spirodelophila TaxID=1707787 RepID=A0A167MGY6_9CHLO|nr:ribosomal protein S2 [Koshicola spirodelophila]